MNDRQTELLRLLKGSLFGGGAAGLSCDPAALLSEAHSHGVLLLAVNDADPSLFPDDLRQELSHSVKRALERDLRIGNAHVMLSNLLEAEGIGHTLIKGLASAVWYPAPELRQTGDVDFYVEPQDVERTQEFLVSRGFEPLKLSHGVHRVFKKDGCRFELHFNVSGLPSGEAGKVCEGLFADLIARSQIKETPFGAARMPSDLHHGLILLLHTAHHLTNSGVGLRHLCDWAVFASGLSGDSGFPEEFTQALKKTGLLGFALCLDDICVRYLGAPGTLPVTEDKELSDTLLDDMLSGGNLGQGDGSLSKQAYFITSGKKERSPLSRFFKVMTDMVYQKWPASRSFKPLVPVGWGWFALKYLIKAATGKRPALDLRKTVKRAGERTQLYDRLRLFEAEKEKI